MFSKKHRLTDFPEKYAVSFTCFSFMNDFSFGTSNLVATIRKVNSIFKEGSINKSVRIKKFPSPKFSQRFKNQSKIMKLRYFNKICMQSMTLKI